MPTLLPVWAVEGFNHQAHQDHQEEIECLGGLGALGGSKTVPAALTAPAVEPRRPISGHAALTTDTG